MSQGQDEFYFRLPYQQMDVILWAYNNDVVVSDLTRYLNLTDTEAASAHCDIESKRAGTGYQHASPRLVERVLTW